MNPASPGSVCQSLSVAPGYPRGIRCQVGGQSLPLCVPWGTHMVSAANWVGRVFLCVPLGTHVVSTTNWAAILVDTYLAPEACGQETSSVQ